MIQQTMMDGDCQPDCQAQGRAACHGRALSRMYLYKSASSHLAHFKNMDDSYAAKPKRLLIVLFINGS